MELVRSQVLLQCFERQSKITQKQKSQIKFGKWKTKSTLTQKPLFQSIRQVSHGMGGCKDTVNGWVTLGKTTLACQLLGSLLKFLWMEFSCVSIYLKSGETERLTTLVVPNLSKPLF